MCIRILVDLQSSTGYCALTVLHTSHIVQQLSREHLPTHYRFFREEKRTKTNRFPYCYSNLQLPQIVDVVLPRTNTRKHFGIARSGSETRVSRQNLTPNVSPQNLTPKSSLRVILITVGQNSESIFLDDGDPGQEANPYVMQRDMSKSLQDTRRRSCKTESANQINPTLNHSQWLCFPRIFASIAYFTQSVQPVVRDGRSQC